VQQNLQISNYSYYTFCKTSPNNNKSYYNDFKINFKTGDVIAQKPAIMKENKITTAIFINYLTNKVAKVF
jgi:hypothetical protein